MTEITHVELKQINDTIELGEALERLRENKDFKKIIQEFFLEGGAINLTRNLTFVKPEDEANLIEQIKARSYLFKFLDMIDNDTLDAREALRIINEDDSEV